MKSHALSPITALVLVLALALAACAPAAPTPTAAPAKPAPTAAPAVQPTAKPAAKAETQPAATAAPAKTEAKPSPQPATKTEPKPAAKTEAKPAAKSAYDERAVADFYRDKTFKIIVSFGAGGGFDTIYRLWGRHASKYIPGNPNVIVENMTGAGGLIAANHLYNVAPKDGTVMGTADYFTAVLGQAAGAPGIEFDARKFNWVGDPGDTSPTVCAIRSDLGLDSFEAVASSGRELVMGASGKGNVFYATPRVVAAATGANFRIIDGYTGNPAVRAAIEGQELDGACWGYASMSTVAPHWFEGNPPPMRVILQSGERRSEDLPDVPLIRDYVKDPQLTQMVGVLEEAVYHAYLSTLPPETPADRVAAIRDAWVKTWNDPELQQEMARTSFKFKPVHGTETQQLVERTVNMPEAEAKQIGEVFGLIN